MWMTYARYWPHPSSAKKGVRTLEEQAGGQPAVASAARETPQLLRYLGCSSEPDTSHREPLASLRPVTGRSLDPLLDS